MDGQMDPKLRPFISSNCLKQTLSTLWLKVILSELLNNGIWYLILYTDLLKNWVQLIERHLVDPAVRLTTTTYNFKGNAKT